MRILFVVGIEISLFLLSGCADWESKYNEEERRRENLSSRNAYLKSELNKIRSNHSLENNLLKDSEDNLKIAQDRASEKGYDLLKKKRLSTIIVCIFLFVWGLLLILYRNIIYRLFKVRKT